MSPPTAVPPCPPAWGAPAPVFGPAFPPPAIRTWPLGRVTVVSAPSLPLAGGAPETAPPAPTAHEIVCPLLMRTRLKRAAPPPPPPPAAPGPLAAAPDAPP